MNTDERKIDFFEQRVKTMLKTLHMRNRAFAEKIGISESYVSRITKGKIQYGGIKFWAGISLHFPTWGAYLRGETMVPPRSITMPTIKHSKVKELYQPDRASSAGRKNYFARNLAYYMHRDRHNQASLGEAVGCSQSTIARYLKYTTDDEVNRAQKIITLRICELFHVSIDAMMHQDLAADTGVVTDIVPYTGEPDIIRKARIVLQSDTPYSTALGTNINAFFTAVMAGKPHKPPGEAKNGD